MKYNPEDIKRQAAEKIEKFWNGPKAEQYRKKFDARFGEAKEWSRIHFRRWSCLLHDLLNDHRGALDPLGFLAVSAVLGVTVTLSTLYSTSYAVTVDGQPVGVVKKQETVAEAIQVVEQEGTDLLGYDYQVDGEVDYKFTVALKTDLSDEQEIEDFFYDQLSEVSDQLRKCEVLVNGQSMGVVDDEEDLDDMLRDMKKQYVTENTVQSRFLENVSVDYVYDAETVMTAEEMETALQANTTGATTYSVAQGDTFNGIAYANDMSVSDLKALNPNVDINRLMVGDVLNVKEVIPALSVETVDHEVYTEPIACPVETREDSSMYKGTTKIITQGEEGEAQVEANVTYINGVEKNREILSTQTLREPTTTVQAVGTKEKPKTASTGSYSWPIRGKITSYFGSRYIFGRRSFHSGIDIKASHGAPIKAADGGTVTFAGNKGSYGKLVIITHDNGTQTYYAHNSSLLVSAGQKVYKGQTIAKAGSTGRSTGTHCHFEIRVHGTAVNPLNYL